MFWCGWPGMPKVSKVRKLQNLGKKEVNKFNFLHEDKNQSFFQADTIVYGGHNQTCPKYPKQQVFAIFLQICASFSCTSMPHSGCSALHGVNPNSKKKKKVDFLHADKQTFLQVDTINIGEYG